jgi:hypothetical protein
VGVALPVIAVCFAATWVSLPGSLPYLGYFGHRETQYGSAGRYTETTYHPASKKVAAPAS